MAWVGGFGSRRWGSCSSSWRRFPSHRRGHPRPPEAGPRLGMGRTGPGRDPRRVPMWSPPYGPGSSGRRSPAPARRSLRSGPIRCSSSPRRTSARRSGPEVTRPNRHRSPGPLRRSGPTSPPRTPGTTTTRRWCRRSAGWSGLARDGWICSRSVGPIRGGGSGPRGSATGRRTTRRSPGCCSWPRITGVSTSPSRSPSGCSSSSPSRTAGSSVSSARIARSTSSST